MSQLRLSSEVDRFLMRQELERLRQRGFSFAGRTEQEQLGVDSWVLGVSVVEDKQQPKKGKTK